MIIDRVGVSVRNVLLVSWGTVRRTGSGKIERPAMPEQLVAGRAPASHSVLGPDIGRLPSVNPQ